MRDIEFIIVMNNKFINYLFILYWTPSEWPVLLTGTTPQNLTWKTRSEPHDEVGEGEAVGAITDPGLKVVVSLLKTFDPWLK